jgi:radical SAM protein with 4Fe4S-binding SPASM domain
MVSPRTIRAKDRAAPRPIYCVWEITLRCDHACAHCGSRAGPAAREDELTTEEMLEVADALVRLGTREVTLIGGEAYLRSDVYRLSEHLAKQGVRVTMQTGGRGLTPTRCRRLKEAGMAAIGVSVDGPAHVHDALRASPGSHEAALRAIDNAVEAGFVVTSNSQINRLNLPHLRETVTELRSHGIVVWRGQLTAPMGRAADRPEWILQPYMMLELAETLASMQLEAVEEARAKGLPPSRAFNIGVGNNVGYYGPWEQVLRSRPGGDERHWEGCQAGKYVMGIESDGRVKGCPSLPTAPYIGANVRDISLEEIWAEGQELQFARDWTPDELWGYCAECYYADICRAGCSFTSHSTLGRRGNNPFCWHRAEQFRRKGLREILVQKDRAPGEPYDFGRFELQVEPWSDASVDPSAQRPLRSLPVVS